MNDEIEAFLRRALDALVQEIGPRPAGSEGHERSARWLAEILAGLGLDVEVDRTACPRWEVAGASLTLGDRTLEVVANPHSPAADVTAPLAIVRDLAHLRCAAPSGAIAVLSGDLTASPFLPRNFDVYREEIQDEILESLEAARPAAVVTASALDVPIPVIEDSDFALPSATVSRGAGARLLDAAGQVARLRIDATTRPGFASTVVARGPAGPPRRLLVCAHHDTKHYTRGAVDDASGVAALLALARLLADGPGLAGIDIVAFGGEDSWYPADAEFVERHGSRLSTLAAVVNVDAIGAAGFDDTVAFLACPEDLVASVLAVVDRHPGVSRVEPWYQGDHGLFWPRGIPCLAVTSAGSFAELGTIFHTPRDTLDRVDPERLGRTVRFLHDVVEAIRERGP